jgi:DNA-binding GntR family transcriptional regulator
MRNTMRSITEQIYQQLKADLIACKLRPGQRLRTNEISDRFGVSLSGVREALSRLSAEGLVDSDPQRGFRAAPISTSDLLALTEASIGIEGLLIRQSFARGDEAWQRKVHAACQKIMETSPTRTDNEGRINDAFLRQHQSFHEALISACDNKWLWRMRESCYVQAERYRQICLPFTSELEKIYAGYAEITEAALARDADRAIVLVGEQLRRNAHRFLTVLEEGKEMSFWQDRASPPVAV